MPALDDNLIAYLKTISNVTDKVGTGDNARIYSEYAKQGAALPYIVIQVFDGVSNEHLTGISGVDENRVQIDCYGSDKTEAYNLAEAVRLAPLQMYRGTLGSGYANSVTSGNTYETGHSPASPGANNQKFWYSRDYFIRHTVATA